MYKKNLKIDKSHYSAFNNLNFAIQKFQMKNIIIGFFFFLTLNILNAQTEILRDNGAWLTFSNKINVSEKIFFTNTIQQRRVAFLKNTQMLLISPGINYKLSKNLTIGAGYLNAKYFPNGVSHSSINKSENRLYQQITIGTISGKFKLSQRFRFEERVIDLINSTVEPNIIEGNTYANRFRYRIQATTNLFKLRNNNYIMGKFSNEIRIRFAGGGISTPDFDQNNFAALLGYKLASNSAIWIGYGKYYARKNASLFISNDILDISLSYDFDFNKKKTN